MPELPEVETIKRDLERKIIGRRFVGVTLYWPKMLQNSTPEAFERNIMSTHVEEADRRGKYLILRLSNGMSLIMHLKMSGSLRLDTACDDDRHIRAVFSLDDGANLYFRDPRKFGRIWLVADEKEIVGKLGPEPLEKEFTTDALKSILGKRHTPIKAVLCDQRLIAGIGNMYADEALFAAAIHPLRKASSLSTAEIKRLHRAIRIVLQEALASGGASISDYSRPDGSSGEAQFAFKVAHQRGKTCPNCKTPIERIVVRQRGTYFCPVCQSQK
jgi:formamidopyrimidine-DNA glycosylase